MKLAISQTHFEHFRSEPRSPLTEGLASSCRVWNSSCIGSSSSNMLFAVTDGVPLLALLVVLLKKPVILHLPPEARGTQQTSPTHGDVTWGWGNGKAKSSGRAAVKELQCYIVASAATRKSAVQMRKMQRAHGLLFSEHKVPDWWRPVSYWPGAYSASSSLGITHYLSVTANKFLKPLRPGRLRPKATRAAIPGTNHALF